MVFATKLTPAALLAVLLTAALAMTKLATDAWFYRSGQDLLWQGPLIVAMTWSLALANILSARTRPRRSVRRGWIKTLVGAAMFLLAAVVLMAALFQLQRLISPRVISTISTGVLLLLLLYSLWRSHGLPRTPPMPSPWAT